MSKNRKDNQPLTLREVIREGLKWLLSTVGLAILGMVFIPFYWIVSLPALGAILCGAYLIIRDWHRIRFFRLGVACILLLGGFLWLTFGMFVAPSGALYCFAGDAGSVLDARFETLPYTNNQVNILYVTDPVRRSDVVRSIVEHYTDKPIFVKSSFDGSQHVMYLPLRMAVTHRVSGISAEGGAFETSVFYFGPQLEITGSDISLDIEASLGYLNILDSITTSDVAHGTVWQAVPYVPGTGLRAAKYVAYIDFALNAASNGDFGQALDCIEAAYQFATGTELARDRALGAVVARAVVTGKFGDTQYLGYLNKAFSDWANILGDDGIKNSGSANGVNLWLRELFQNLVDEYPTQFPNISRLISPQNPQPQSTPQAGPKTGITQATLLTGPYQNLIEMDRREVAKVALKALPDCSQVRSLLQARFGASINDQLWMIDALHSFGASKTEQAWIRSLPGGIVSLINNDLWFIPSMSLDLFNGLRLSALKCVVEKLPEPWRKKNEAFNQQLQAVIELNGPKSTLAASQDPGARAEAMGFSNFATFLRSYYSVKHKAEISVPPPTDPPSLPWWNHKYLDWFAMTAMQIVLSSSDPCTNDEALLQNAVAKFTRDTSAEHYVFAPGIMVTIVLSQSFGISTDPSETVTFFHTVGVDPATLIPEEQLSDQVEPQPDVSPKTDSFRLSEILIPAEKGASEEQKTRSRLRAGCALKRLQNGDAFEDIASRFSENTPADGDLGYFVHGGIAEALETVVSKLKVGEFSDVIQTNQGFVILKVTDRK